MKARKAALLAINATLEKILVKNKRIRVALEALPSRIRDESTAGSSQKRKRAEEEEEEEGDDEIDFRRVSG